MFNLLALGVMLAGLLVLVIGLVLFLSKRRLVGGILSVVGLIGIVLPWLVSFLLQKSWQ